MEIIEALEASDIEYRQGSSEEEIWICCPFCLEEGETQDTRFRLGVNLVSGKMGCFNCGKKGRGDYTFQELQRALDTGELEAQQTERHHKKKRRHRKVMLPEGFRLLQHPDEEQDHWNNKVWRYVRRRGVSERQIKEKQIGFTVIGDYSHRVILPYYRHSKLIGFVGRDITDTQELKYKNSIGDKAIYNLPGKTHHKTLCLSEGGFDALAIERGSLKLGIDSGALLGHVLKDDQLELIAGYKRIIIWPDPDAAGIKGVIKNAKKLPDKIVEVILPKGFLHEGAEDKDPSELDPKEITTRLTGVVRYTEELGQKLRAWYLFEE